MTLQARLFLLVVVSVLPILCLLGYNEVGLRQARTQEFHEQTLRQAKLLGAELDRIVDGGHQLLMSLAELPAVKKAGAECDEMMRALAARFPQYIYIGAIDRSGRTYCAGESPPDTDVSDRAWFRQALESGGFTVGEYLIGRATGAPTIHFAYPIRDRSNAVTGVVGAALSLDWLHRHIAEKPQLPDSTVTVADRNGTIIFRHPDHDAFMGRALPKGRLRDRAPTEPSTVETLGFEGVWKIVGFVPLSYSDARSFDVGVGVPKDVVLAEIDRLLWRDLGVIAAGVLIALASAWIVGRCFVRRPIDRLLITINGWSSGDRSTRLDPRRLGGEFGRLGAAFNKMAASLAEREHELIVAKEDAEAASRAKSEFLATMSHELRTPLNAILGFSEIIRDARFGPVPARYADYAGDIHSSGRHLLTVINDILDLSKIEAGRMEIAKEPVDLAKVVRACGQIMRGKAVDGGLRLSVHLPDAAAVLGDELRLKQITLNVLSNAIKFTPADGQVSVVVTARGGEAALSVSDTGIGMTRDEIRTALEPFRQVDSSQTRRFEGTGLGLPLVLRLVELHGGRVDIRSEKGAGTTVKVILPAFEAAGAHETSRAEAG